MTARTVIGVEHSDRCLCGCGLVVGLPGVVLEADPRVNVVVVRFDVPNTTTSGSRPVRVSYSFAEAFPVRSVA